MCRWGCATVDTTHMCKWCGTRYCRDCLRGEFYGLMADPTTCKKCFQKRCQGPKVEYYPPKIPPEDPKKSKGQGRSAAASKKTMPMPASTKRKPTEKIGGKKIKAKKKKKNTK